MQHNWLQSPLLNEMPGLSHVFSNRLGGQSSGPFAELNLKYPMDQLDETGAENTVMANRQILCDFLGFDLQDLVACQQCHGNRIQKVSESDRGRGAFAHQDGFAATDGLITNSAGVLLMTMVADCVPVLIADPVQHVIAAVHSGWRGTQQRIARQALRHMQQDFGSLAENIRFVTGPAISYEAFEVGGEVVEAFADQVDVADSLYAKAVGEKYRLNLGEILRQQALAEGLNSAHIEISSECTFSNQNYYSYRRQGGLTGRQAGFIAWRF